MQKLKYEKIKKVLFSYVPINDSHVAVILIRKVVFWFKLETWPVQYWDDRDYCWSSCLPSAGPPGDVTVKRHSCRTTDPQTVWDLFSRWGCRNQRRQMLFFQMPHGQKWTQWTLTAALMSDGLLCVSRWGSHSKWGCLWFLPRKNSTLCPRGAQRTQNKGKLKS